MAVEVEYVCPSCGGSGEVSYGHENSEGDVINEGTSTCWTCNRTGRAGNEQVFRHRVIVLARKLAERAVAIRQDTPLKEKAFVLEGERHGMGVETFTEVSTMESQGHFESELLKLRPDLIETLFDVLNVPKPERCIDQDDAREDVPF